jgi:hypothetical protein
MGTLSEDSRLAPKCQAAARGHWLGPAPPELVRTPEDALRNWSAPQPRSQSVMVLPELRAILIRHPKCASMTTMEFFRAGRRPLFRPATKENDGVGAVMKGFGDMDDFVHDLGETAASRRMKREFFTFSFVCEPFRRLVSAYGTITRRSKEHGGALQIYPSTAWYTPPFANISRWDEPRRFEQFAEDLRRFPDMLFETASGLEKKRLSTTTSAVDIHGLAWHHARSQLYYMTSTDRLSCPCARGVASSLLCGTGRAAGK